MLRRAPRSTPARAASPQFYALVAALTAVYLVVVEFVKWRFFRLRAVE